MKKKLIIIAYLILLSLTITYAQKVKQKAEVNHSPKKAAIMSMVLPGLGQAYNKKYWKIPIIYAGVTIVSYSLKYNYDNYNTYRNAYTLRTDGDTSTIDNFYPGITENGLLKLRNYYRRNLDFTIVSGVLLYILNIIDANVDAHLFGFNINDDLSLKTHPFLQQYGKANYLGVNLTLNFR